jgi:hypothetical protein
VRREESRRRGQERDERVERRKKVSAEIMQKAQEQLSRVGKVEGALTNQNAGSTRPSFAGWAAKGRRGRAEGQLSSTKKTAKLWDDSTE